MTETRAVARLPNLEIEILHRRLPHEDAEQLAISLKAHPSFEAFARFVEASGPFWPWLTPYPMLAWPALLQAVWSPWLSAPSRGMSEPQQRRRED